MHLRLNKLTNHLFLTFQFGKKHRKRWKRNGRKTSGGSAGWEGGMSGSREGGGSRGERWEESRDRLKGPGRSVIQLITFLTKLWGRPYHFFESALLDVGGVIWTNIHLLT